MPVLPPSRSKPVKCWRCYQFKPWFMCVKGIWGVEGDVPFCEECHQNCESGGIPVSEMRRIISDGAYTETE